MPRPQLLVLTTAALLLEALPLVAAHGDEHEDANHEMHLAVPSTASDTGLPLSCRGRSDHASHMYWHIALEMLAWVVVLPVGMFGSIPAKDLY